MLNFQMKTKLENTIAENKSKFEKAFATIDQNMVKPIKLEDLQRSIIATRIK